MTHPDARYSRAREFALRLLLDETSIRSRFDVAPSAPDAMVKDAAKRFIRKVKMTEVQRYTVDWARAAKKKQDAPRATLVITLSDPSLLREVKNNLRWASAAYGDGDFVACAGPTNDGALGLRVRERATGLSGTLLNSRNDTIHGETRWLIEWDHGPVAWYSSETMKKASKSDPYEKAWADPAAFVAQLLSLAPRERAEAVDALHAEQLPMAFRIGGFSDGAIPGDALRFFALMHRLPDALGTAFTLLTDWANDRESNMADEDGRCGVRCQYHHCSSSSIGRAFKAEVRGVGG